jgi:hypothetical protein
MRDDLTDESLIDPSTQKSVSDWLMQVISGRKPVEEPAKKVEVPIAKAAPVETRAEPEWKVAPQAVEIPKSTNSAVAIAEAPEIPKPEIPTTEPVNAATPVASASSEPAPAERVLTLEDISRGPVIETAEPPKSVVTVEDIIREPRVLAESVTEEPTDSVITPKDISREDVPSLIEPEESLIADIRREPGVWSSPPADVRVEDIFLEGAPQVIEPEKSAIAAEQVASKSEPESPMSTVAAESALPKPEVIEPPASMIKSAEQSRERGPETLAAEPRAIEPAESVFAHEGIWGATVHPEAAGQEADILRESVGRYPSPDMGPGDLKDLARRPPEGWNSAWKTLLRLGSVLPWVARALPMLESGVINDQNPGLAHDAQHEVASMRMAQYEMKTAVQDNSLQLKKVEEQLARLRESMESDNSENSEVVETVKSAVNLMRLMGIGVGVLLLVLIIMVGLVLAHH